MLADSAMNSQSGSLGPEVHPQRTQLHVILELIARQLPIWRDELSRPVVTAEDDLTNQLCTYLNSVSKNSGLDHYRFRTEERDEVKKRNKLDLTVHPLDETITVEGLRTKYEILFPIECKRLPTPKDGNKRDEREYVRTEPKKAGGIERFKLGKHGASHRFAAMIGYVQEQTASFWLEKVNGWIRELWSVSDELSLDVGDLPNGLCTLHSQHKRNGIPDIDIHHLWIQMN